MKQLAQKNKKIDKYLSFSFFIFYIYKKNWKMKSWSFPQFSFFSFRYEE